MPWERGATRGAGPLGPRAVSPASPWSSSPLVQFEPLFAGVASVACTRALLGARSRARRARNPRSALLRGAVVGLGPDPDVRVGAISRLALLGECSRPRRARPAHFTHLRRSPLVSHGRAPSGSRRRRGVPESRVLHAPRAVVDLGPEHDERVAAWRLSRLRARRCGCGVSIGFAGLAAAGAPARTIRAARRRRPRAGRILASAFRHAGGSLPA